MKLLTLTVFILFTTFCYSQCTGDTIVFDDFEHTNVDPAVNIDCCFTSGIPPTNGAYNGNQGMYLNTMVFPGETEYLIYNRIFEVCPYEKFRMSAWLSTRYGGVQCNMDITIFDANDNVLFFFSGFIPYASNGWLDWQSDPFIPTTNSIRFEIVSNNVSTSSGNDFAMDDLLLQMCPSTISTQEIVLCDFDTTIHLFESLQTISSTSGHWTGPQSLSNGHLGTFNPTSIAEGLYIYQVSSTTICPAKKENIELKINEAHDFVFNDTIICGFKEAKIGIPNNPSVNYEWNTGSNNSQIEVTQDGDYYLNTTKNGCLFSDTINVKFYHNFNLSNDTILCNEDTFVVTAPDEFDNYQWNTGAATNQITIKNAGNYWLWVESDNCVLYSDTLQVIHRESPTFKTLFMDTLVCANKPYVLYVDGRDYTSVLWYNNSLDLSDTIYSENLYWVDIINQCGSVRDEVQITTENCDCEITVPTAFTPNEDLLNDHFYFKSSIDCSTTYYRLEIYDRWGTLIFTSLDVNEDWNGYYNGKRCPIGVYTCKYNVKFKHDTQRRTIIKDLTIIE